MPDTPPTTTVKGPLIRNISDIALWVAVYRAWESERPDAIFKDPLARRLAGERGEQIAQSTEFGQKVSWPYVARTYRFDQLVAQAVQQGADVVVNLAAGLDTRPYRMALPPQLQWVEVDLPAITDYKEQILAGEKPVCALTRVRLDLSDVASRRALFADLGRRAKKAMIVTEGLMAYFSRDEVTAFAHDLAAHPSFQHWALDMASPGLLKMLQKELGESLGKAGSPLKFAPEEGPGFFTTCGWEPVEVYSMLKTAAHLKRLSFGMHLLALLPDSNGRQGSRPWGGVCLLKRK
ncbi:MAG: class I SAM-dependent methyltransferase [Terriglobales bacterium]